MLYGPVGYSCNITQQGLERGHLALKEKVLVTQSCLTLCNPVEHSLPGSSVHGILQARMLDLNFMTVDSSLAISPWPPPLKRRKMSQDGGWVLHPDSSPSF